MALYKRSIFLINPKFQIKFSLIICSLIFISSLVYPITIIELFDSFFHLLPDSNETLKDARDQLILYLSIYQIIFIIIVFILAIFLTHKVAGPMYKLTTYLKNIRNGATPTKLFFRSGDNFQEVAEEVNELIDYLVDNHERDYAYLEEVISYINNLSLVVPEDKKPVITEINSKLRDIQKRLKSE